MAQICTTRTQSKYLLKLGVPADTADMFYPLGASFPEACDNGDNLQVDYPAWSLGALIELMPDKIKGNIFCLVYDLNIGKNHIVYSNRQGDDDVLKYEAYGDLVDCCVEIIEQLTKDGHIKICNND